MKDEMKKIRYTNKAKQMTAKAIASLVMSENDYLDAVSTWRNNNQNVCSLKAQILGGISPDHLVELGLAEIKLPIDIINQYDNM